MQEDARTIHLFTHEGKQFIIDVQWSAAGGEGVDITFSRDAHVWHGFVPSTTLEKLTSKSRWSVSDLVAAMRAAFSGRKRTDKSHHRYFIHIREKDKDKHTGVAQTIKLHWYMQKLDKSDKEHLMNRCVLKLDSAKTPTLALTHLYSETFALKDKMSELQEAQETERDAWQAAYDELKSSVEAGLERERLTMSLGYALLRTKERRLEELRDAVASQEHSRTPSQAQAQDTSATGTPPPSLHAAAAAAVSSLAPSSAAASASATSRPSSQPDLSRSLATRPSTASGRPHSANTSTASHDTPSPARVRPTLQSSASTDLDLAPSPVKPSITSPRKKRHVRRTGTLKGSRANAAAGTAPPSSSSSFVKSLHFSRDRQQEENAEGNASKRPKVTPAQKAVIAADPSHVTPQDDERLLEEL